MFAFVLSVVDQKPIDSTNRVLFRNKVLIERVQLVFEAVVLERNIDQIAITFTGRDQLNDGLEMAFTFVGAASPRATDHF